MACIGTPLDEHATVEMVRRLQAGETDAWSDLYRRYRDELLLSIRLHMGPRLRSSLQSEDVLQSVALAAFRAAARFEDRGPGSLRRFLGHLLLQKLRSHGRALAARKRAGAVPLTETVAEAAAAPPCYHDERYERLERALHALPADMRQIIVLRRLEGLDYDSAAARMQRTPDAVRKLYSRALARLTLLVHGEA